MRAVITGGLGFLGRRLAQRLADDDRWSRITLFDQAHPGVDWRPPSSAVHIEAGDVTDPRRLAAAISDDTTVVYHLASVVSAGAEADFDLGYRVNLHGTIAVLERCRALPSPPIVVFTSSLAAFGPAAGTVADDSTALRPQTSYGVHKATGELLVNDFTRRGFVDGRTLRLPTVVVRPGEPNKAASGFASGIIREPLNGIDTVCPVGPETVMAVISPRRVIDALTHVIDIPGGDVGPDRTVLLPGLPMSMTEAVVATQANRGGRRLGRVEFRPDDEIQRIIESWPPEIVSPRSAGLGFLGDSSVAAIVRQHIEDELEE